MGDYKEDIPGALSMPAPAESVKLTPGCEVIVPLFMSGSLTDTYAKRVVISVRGKVDVATPNGPLEYDVERVAVCYTRDAEETAYARCLEAVRRIDKRFDNLTQAVCEHGNDFRGVFGFLLGALTATVLCLLLLGHGH